MYIHLRNLLTSLTWTMYIHLRNLIVFLIWMTYIHLRNLIIFYVDDAHPFKESDHLLFLSGFQHSDGDFSLKERHNQNI